MSTAAAVPEADSDPSVLLLLTMGLIGVFAFIQVYSIQSILPQLLLDLRASVVQVGNAVGATVLAVALVSPFTGMVSDALGRKALIVGSVFFLALPTALALGADSIGYLTVLRFLQGLTVPGITVVTIAYIGEEFRGRGMARVMSVYVAGTVLGGFLGRFMMGHLTEWMSWRHAFVVLAVLNVAGGVLIARVLPPSRHFVPNPNLRSSLHSLAALLRNRFVLIPSALGMCVLFSLVGVFTYVNLHLAAAPFYFSPAQLANVFAVYLLGVLITPLAGRVLPRLGARRTILGALGVSALGVALTLVPSAPVIVLALAIASSGIFVTQASTISFIATRVTQGRSLASGLYYMAYYTGGSIGAWACGLVYTHGAWPATVALLLAVQGLGLVIVWALMPPRAPAP